MAHAGKEEEETEKWPGEEVEQSILHQPSGLGLLSSNPLCREMSGKGLHPS